MRLSGSMILIVVVLAGFAWAAENQDRHPVYVGARVCATCHDGKGMGHQFSQWLGSKHARAYAILSSPKAKDIARLSGIPQEPQEATMCLGCHATGAHVEDWEKDDTFFMQDGVQCEKCHGPGSEYMDMAVMTDHDAATRAGLIIPTLQDCEACHLVKGSHAAIHNLPKLDMEKAIKRIAHPTPDAWKLTGTAQLPQPKNGEPEHTGAMACGTCHKGPAMGYQFSLWQNSKHARAYADLATPKAYDIAKERGLTTPPQASPECLKCHSTAFHLPAGGPSESLMEGVGCEACHGAGSKYSAEAVMTDPAAAKAAGLRAVNKDVCVGCHKDETFDVEAAMKKIAHPTLQPEPEKTVQYKTPLNLALSPNGRELYVAGEASSTVMVVDATTREKIDEIPVGRHATDVTFAPDGTRAYVSNRLDDTVSVIDVRTRKMIATLPVGDEPHGVLTDASGKNLYVLNTSEDSISVIDTKTLTEHRRLSASRRPWSLARSPDGSSIYVTNTLSRFVKFRTPSVSEVTVIDTERMRVTNRIELPGTNLLQGIAWHPSGEFALATMNRTKNLVPMTRLLQGWTVTNGLGVLWKDGHTDQVLLDEPNLCFPDPADVAITPDGRLALVTSSGSNRVAVIDVEKLISMLKAATPHERTHVFPNHVGKPTEFVIAHITTKNSPRGVLVSEDGKTAFVANALDDSVTV
ncbi:MAG: beta-propeller fold lactonase family protein, partial [Phycisphaeraceae bacterium]|nr:beta-propeller fold lactonase family protein [Phycisphaeraceae bacterium]